MTTKTASRCAQRLLRLSLLYWLITLAAGAVADTDEEFVPANPSNMLAMEKYYEIQDLAEAADTLRRDATRFGLDVLEHPVAGKAAHPYTVLHLPVTQMRPDFGDGTYLQRLSIKGAQDGAGREFVAILAVHRELSIDEVAGIFESGIRILEKLFAGTAQEYFGGYILQGPADALVALRDREYFSWLGEYRSDLRWQEDLGPSSLDQYSITLYKRYIADAYYADLEALGARVINQSASFRRIGVECSWDAVQRILELDWVRTMYPIEHVVNDMITQQAFSAGNGAKIQHRTALAQNARILAGSAGGGNGSNVRVGVVDNAIEFQGGRECISDCVNSHGVDSPTGGPHGQEERARRSG